MSLSYTGKLFQRIVVTSGYTYGKNLRVSYYHMQTKYADDYADDDMLLNWIYRRSPKSGRWMAYDLHENYTNEYQFWKALRWLEENGYITVRWFETVSVSRLCTGKDHFIKLTDKGLELAPKYLRH